MVQSLLVVAASWAAWVLTASACQVEVDTNIPQLIKRKADFPPVLDETEALLVNSFDNNTIRDWSYYYTHGAHLAGRNKSMADWTSERFAENGIPSHLNEYHVYLSYPVSHSVSLTYPNGSIYALTLEEAVLQQDETTSSPDRIPTCNGYSASGNVTGEYVYVGRGSQADFKRIVALGIPLEGKIALARYGGGSRGLKVKNAQEYGMIGCIMFNDPEDDGKITEANGYAAYPDGPARNPSSVQRGTVSFTSYPGDPTTPGYASHIDSRRVDPSDQLPRIPTLPISWLEAAPLLAALDGHGASGIELNRTGWVGKLNVTYSTGPAPGAVISLSVMMDNVVTPIWNVIGVINGTNADETVIIGNHRDAWVVGGASDPNSGSAVVIELSRALGKLVKKGWKPKRNIVIASWDAEEYGLIGSTEWVEEFLDPWLKGTAISYLNMDSATYGSLPGFEASPELHAIAADVMKKVIFPYKGGLNQTMYDIWQIGLGGRPRLLESSTDYVAFLQNGIGAVNMGSIRGPDDPIYHYHSNFDSFYWMTTFGDPGFQIHKAMGQYLTLLAYHLANDEVIPFDIPNWSSQLDSYYSQLTLTANNSGQSLDLSALSNAIDTFRTRAAEIKSQETLARSNGDAAMLTRVNHMYRDFQRGFVSQGGLPGREFYKHTIFAPAISAGSGTQTFPGITEAVAVRNLTLAAEWVTKTANAVLAAAEALNS